MFKHSTKPGVLSAEAMWQFYVKDYLLQNPTYTTKYLRNTPNGQILNEEGKVVFTYTEFKEVLSEHNKLIGKKLIEGYAYDLGNGLGDLFIARIERAPSNKALNKAESMKLHAKLKSEGKLTSENWKVYYTDDDFIMVLWYKTNKSLRNILLYKFKTAGGQPGKGFRQTMSYAVKTNPLRKAMYPFIPHKVPVI